MRLYYREADFKIILMLSDDIVNNPDEEILRLAFEHQEGIIEPDRFMRLNKLLAEKSQARAVYLDMLTLRKDLMYLFGNNTDTQHTPARTESTHQK